MAIFVTGGTGYIGQKLIQLLIRSGDELHVLLRKQSDRTGLEHPRIHLFEGDVLDKVSIRRAIRGCTHTYHLAAYARVWARSREAFYSHNVNGVRNVVEACGEFGVGRVVVTSTVVTLGPTNGGVVDEAASRGNHFFTDYELSKYLAEKEALKYATRGLDVVIVNPTRVYGPGKLNEANAVTRMIGLYVKGKFPLLLDQGQHVGNYVLVDDVASGHLLAMEKGRSGGRYVLGGENASLKELFDLIREITGVRKMQVKVPALAARSVGVLEEIRARLFHSSPLITRAWVETFLHHWSFSSKKAMEELGYAFTPLREGLEKTWKWLAEGPGNSLLRTL